MMMSRGKKVATLLAREKVDALLVVNNEGSGQPATAWLTGFTGSSSFLFVAKTAQYLITDGRYRSQSKEEAGDCTVYIMDTKNSHARCVRRCVDQVNLTHILFDGDSTTFSAVKELEALLPSVTLVSKRKVLQELRCVKEAKEQKLLEHASIIACRAFTSLVAMLCTGMTEKGIAELLESLCAKEGGEGMAFPTIVASGIHGALPHATPSDKQIAPGELVTIDFGVLYKGYVSDMTRTIAVGKVSARFQNMYEAVRQAQEAGCKKVKAGISGADLDRVCRDVLMRRGLGKYFSHSTGHGIGREVHELPQVSPSAKEPLAVGSVITCEPGVYIPNVGGVRIEDALVVTKAGARSLTDTVTKELIHI